MWFMRSIHIVLVSTACIAGCTNERPCLKWESYPTMQYNVSLKMVLPVVRQRCVMRAPKHSDTGHQNIR